MCSLAAIEECVTFAYYCVGVANVRQAIDRGDWATHCLIEILRRADIIHGACRGQGEACLQVIAT